MLHPDEVAPFYGNGTSFACPLIAGLAASLWSALPDENAMQIRERIIRSANRYTTPNDEYGYGVPNAWTAYTGTDGLSSIYGTQKTTKILINNELRIIVGNRVYDIFGRMVNER